LEYPAWLSSYGLEECKVFKGLNQAYAYELDTPKFLKLALNIYVWGIDSPFKLNG